YLLIIGKVEFSNLKCTSWDPEWVDFEYCYLKAYNRTFRYLSLKAKLYKLPVKEIKVNFALLKRFGGLKTTLYNITIDGCKFVKDETKANPIITYLYGFYRVYSNINHTCPYDHDIIMEKIPATVFDTQFSEILPFARGEYLFKSNWIYQSNNKASVHVYLSYT
ncbi:uncharacterized protein, partial [Drosophila kikkawai]|uniref:Uncharacterized protein n=1 Tax=Drosophila kikkawai TaxID=30033 RepID=A0ABM4GI13_DROKI